MPQKFKKILIANRGEIALRILRTAKEYGLSTVTLFSEADCKGLWISNSDESFSLGRGSIADTYLNIEKIISIAIKAGVDCIHPGYGFLSENYLFAAACEKVGIQFIGPSVEVLKLAGNKPSALEYVRKLGINVPNQISGTIQELLSHAPKLQFPFMVKSMAGGGGKGMRLVNSFYETENALKNTSSEALHYFGDDRVYIESYIYPARHIEVQILGDQSGNIIHVFDRECSVQRRNQKVIEEAPVTFLSEKHRGEVTDAALTIARSLRYTNAGTIEFLYKENGDFYFLEINPRLQVEHTVTEMITGMDIVKEQISIAEGHLLGSKKIMVKGHAIEGRIYAEDPSNDFIPSPGNISVFRKPVMQGLRIESCMDAGDEIGGDFDPLIAKIIVHADNRTSAIEKLRVVLNDIHITGCHHNIALLKAITNHKNYQMNQLNTRFLSDNLPVILQNISDLKDSNRTFVILAAALTILMPHKKLSDHPWKTGYWRNTGNLNLLYEGEIIDIGYARYITGYELLLENNSYFIDSCELNDDQFCFTMNGEIRYFYPVETSDEREISFSDGHLVYRAGKLLLAEHADYQIEVIAGKNHNNLVAAPQPGKIVQIRVEEGQLVNPGDDLLVIESMKLENTILAGKSGRVQRIAIKTGDKVKKDEPLIFLQDNN